MHFIDPESHRRHERIDNIINAASELVNNNASVNDALGGEYVDAFNEMTNDYFVPNFRDGLLTLTDEQIASDGHPIFAAESDEMIGLGTGFDTFMPDQKEAIGSYLDEIGIAHAPERADGLVMRWERFIRDNMENDPAFFSLNQLNAQALVRKKYIMSDWSDSGYGLQFVSLRGIAIYRLPDNGSRDTPITNVLHEFVHDNHHRTHPIESCADGEHRLQLRKEEAAYEVNAKISTVQQAQGVALDTYGRLYIETPAILRDTLNMDLEDDVLVKVFDDKFRQRYRELDTETTSEAA